jgi:3'-phosphoadenosine 5'-phosphosulfate sulfotransferase (PAPS reductase)/FAD synthetase
MVRDRGKFPSAQFRQCTSDLKRSPIQKFIRQLRHPVVINCMGMRAQESAQRARQQPWSKDESLSKASRTVFNWLPIFHETTEDVLAWHWRNDVPLHPVYVPEYHRDGTSGGLLRRFSCRVCIFASDYDLRQIHEHDREAFDLVSGLEEQIGFTMKPGKSLVQIVSESRLAESEADQLALFSSMS